MKYLLIALFFFINVGCGTLPTKPTTQTPATVVEPVVAQPVEVSADVSLSWEKTNEARKAWTKTVMSSVDEYWANLSKAPDMKRVCAKYDSFTEADKKIAVGELFVGMMLYESKWVPTERFYEKTMGYYSEGLFQLSVIDEGWIKCGLTKTSILEPHTNIKCGIKVMQRQIGKKGLIFLTKGNYWSVIKDTPEKILRMKTRIETSFAKCKGG